MSISLNLHGGFPESIGIADFSGPTFKNTDQMGFTFSIGDTINATVVETASDGSAPNAYMSAVTFFELPFVVGNGTGVDEWSFVVSRDFFVAHVDTEIDFTVTLTATNSSGQSDGSTSFSVQEFLHPFDWHIIERDYAAIVRRDFGQFASQGEAHSIDLIQTTEANFVSSLLATVANTTIPAVAVEGSMYAAVGTSAEIDNLVNNFLPAQVTNALNNGLNAQVYACEVLGLAFATANENGGTAFATLLGPSNPSLPNTPAGDAAFASAASSAIFAADAGPQTPVAIAGFVANWKAFYTSNGIPGIAHPTADQIDLNARGAAWGDAVGVALANNLGPLPSEVINFLKDAAQGQANYGASLANQPTPGAFEGSTSSASAATEVQLAGIPADPQHIGM